MGLNKEDQFLQVNTMLEAANHSEVVEAMRAWPLWWLVQFLQTLPENYELLSHDIFDDFWAEKRADLNDHIDFVGQKNLKDIDFVCGYLFYLMAHQAKSKSDNEGYTKYLELALEHHSIHAAQTLLNELTLSADDKKSDTLEQIVALLNNWQCLARLHLTSGYLLFANGYLNLLKVYSEQQRSDLYEYACFCLWKNLTLAELYEPQSEAEIQNAYFGKGLSFSNPYKLETIAAMKEACSSLITDDSIKERAQNQARIVYDSSEGQKVKLWTESRGHCASTKIEVNPGISK